MAVFRDAQEVYRYLGQMFKEIMSDPALSDQVQGSGLTIRLNYKDPDSVILVDFPKLAVYYGAEEAQSAKPNVVLSMKADDAHSFWRGQLNLAMAMTKGQVRVKGPVTKMMKLMPLIKHLYARYEQILADDGRTDLLAASN